MIEHSPEINNLAAALIGVQGAVEGVARDKTNPHFRNRYATLEAVIDTARPALQANGLAFTQAPGSVVDGAVEVTTMLMHASGQWMRSTLHVPLGKRDPQGVGSAITYGCRYSLMATLGLPPTDDDGESAVDRAAPQETAPPRKSSAQAKRDGEWQTILESLAPSMDSAALLSWAYECEPALERLPKAWQAEAWELWRLRLKDALSLECQSPSEVAMWSRTHEDNVKMLSPSVIKTCGEVTREVRDGLREIAIGSGLKEPA